MYYSSKFKIKILCFGLPCPTLTTQPSFEGVPQCCGYCAVHDVTRNACLHCSDHIPRVTRKQLWLGGLKIAFTVLLSKCQQLWEKY